MDRSTPMNVESGLSPYCWALNTVEVMACIPGRTRQPQGLPGSLLNSRESPHEFPCQTLEREEVTREHESLLTSLACCKILSPRVVHLIFFFFFLRMSTATGYLYRRRENIKACHLLKYLFVISSYESMCMKSLSTN